MTQIRRRYFLYTNTCVTTQSWDHATARNFQCQINHSLESFVLSHGLNFGLSRRYLCKENIFAEFESLWAQLLHHSASSVIQRTALKARLADLAHLYCDRRKTKLSQKRKENVYRFLMLTSKEQMLALKPVYTGNPPSPGSIYVGSLFSPLKRKVSLISTLVHRALMICTKRRLNGEIEQIKKILLDNGYPKNVINTQITKKIAQFSILKRFGPEKYPVYLRVSWIDKPSTNLKKEVKTAVESCYGSVSTRLVFTSKRMLPVARKNVLSITQKSLVIYEYKCHCNSRYVGRTSQQLQDRIKQHVPQWLRQQLIRPRRSQLHRWCKRNDTKPNCDSATGQHLLENDQSALNYDNKRFAFKLLR